jgi:quercetin dioxygenase-like cupin family protein
MFKAPVFIVLLLGMSAAYAEDPKPPAASTAVRKILEKHDQSVIAGKEIVTGTATFAPDAVIGFHTHPGDEAGYVISGSLTWKTRGKPDQILNAGDSFFNVRGAIHSLAAGPAGAVVVSNWIVDKDTPMVTPVP